MLKVILIVLIAWFVLRTVRNLVLAIAAPRNVPEDRPSMRRQDDRSVDRRQGPSGKDDRDVTDAVWEDIN